jgi:hypothetical protein
MGNFQKCLRDAVALKAKKNREASSKITAQMRTIYVTAQSAPTAGPGASAERP